MVMNHMKAVYRYLPILCIIGRYMEVTGCIHNYAYHWMARFVKLKKGVPSCDKPGVDAWNL